MSRVTRISGVSADLGRQHSCSVKHLLLCSLVLQELDNRANASSASFTHVRVIDHRLLIALNSSFGAHACLGVSLAPLVTRSTLLLTSTRVRVVKLWDLIDELKPVEGEDVVDGCGRASSSPRTSKCFFVSGVTTLVFGGVTTACCVATTMREAQDLGFECWLLADGTGDCSEKDFMDTLRLSSPRVLSCTTFLTRVLHDYRQSLPAPERAALPEEFDWLPELPAMKSLDGGVDGLPVPFHVWATLEAEMLRGGAAWALCRPR